jgi:hypothetical protein
MRHVVLLFTALTLAAVVSCWGGGDDSQNKQSQTLISSQRVTNGLRLTVESQATVPVGGVAKIRLLIEPSEGEILENIGWGGRPFNAFIATGEDEAWNWLLEWLSGGPSGIPRGMTAELNVGDLRRDQPLTFEIEWPTHDADGNSVKPGTYVVRGTVRVVFGVATAQEHHVTLDTPPLAITVTVEKDPESGGLTPVPGAAGGSVSTELVTDELRLVLVSPSLIVLGEEVNMRLMAELLTSPVSGKTITLPGESTDFDIVVRKVGEEIWRASDASIDNADIERAKEFGKFETQLLTQQETWSTSNSKGGPLIPGVYSVTGYLRVVLDRLTDSEEVIDLETSPLLIEVVLSSE